VKQAPLQSSLPTPHLAGAGRQRQPGGSSGGIPPEGRALLQRLMAEGLGDHVLLLRLFQVHALV
jgi:hypothetical protein